MKAIFEYVSGKGFCYICGKIGSFRLTISFKVFRICEECFKPLREILEQAETEVEVYDIRRERRWAGKN